MEAKPKLIPVLKAVIEQLENNSVEYHWKEHHSCNCGVVAQAVLSKTPSELKEITNKLKIDYYKIYPEKFKQAQNQFGETSGLATWTTLAGEFCPITGVPMNSIFKTLYEHGLNRQDICELEYLSNPEIKAKAKLKEKTVLLKETYKVKTEQTYMEKGFIFPTKKTRIIEKIKTRERQGGYYESSKNFISYLKAWVELLEEAEMPKAIPIAEFDNESPCGKAPDGFFHELYSGMSQEALKTHLVQAENNQEFETAAIINTYIKKEA